MKDWAVVGSYTSGLQAALANGMLETAGIPTWVENEHVQAIFGSGLWSVWPTNPAIGPLRIWVPYHALERARAILAQELS